MKKNIPMSTKHTEEKSTETDAIIRCQEKNKFAKRKHWEMSKWCPYGNMCQFAHGKEELRKRKRSNRYKKQRCKNIEYDGTCKYGTRCVFLHK